jgi:hypothetical protein
MIYSNRKLFGSDTIENNCEAITFVGCCCCAWPLFPFIYLFDKLFSKKKYTVFLRIYKKSRRTSL